MALTKKTGNARVKRTGVLIRGKVFKKRRLLRSSRNVGSMRFNVISLSKVVCVAQQFFANDEVVENWMHSKISLLEDKTPIQLCKEGKAQEVIDFLGKVEHGVYQ
jgi:uncharacterized protein (DUF2384 family)